MPDEAPDETPVVFFGQEFAAPDRINSRRINQLAVIGKKIEAAEKNGETKTAGSLQMDYMATVESLVVQVVRPEDRQRFDDLCDEVGPSDEDLMTFIGEVAAVIGKRPTSRSSDSSDGPTGTPPKSEGGSSSAVEREIARQEAMGRPDRAVYLLPHLSVA